MQRRYFKHLPPVTTRTSGQPIQKKNESTNLRFMAAKKRPEKLTALKAHTLNFCWPCHIHVLLIMTFNHVEQLRKPSAKSTKHIVLQNKLQHPSVLSACVNYTFTDEIFLGLAHSRLHACTVNVSPYTPPPCGRR